MSKAVRLNQNTGLLKLIAISSMLIDHIGAVLYQDQVWMRQVGRLAFPIFAYCIAAGSVYTHDRGKYMLRILLIGVIAQPLYVLALHHVTPAMGAIDFSVQPVRAALNWYVGSLQYCNIMFELALGLAVIWTLQVQNYALTAICAAGAWFLTPYLTTSYGWSGIVLMVLFYVLIDRPLASLMWVGGFMAWWGFYSMSGYSILSPRVVLQAYALCALPLIYIPLTSRLKLSKWVFYLFYPGHLAALYLVDRFLM